MNVVEVLEKAKAAIDKPQKWCKGKRHTNPYTKDGMGGKHCAIGAVEVALGKDGGYAMAHRHPVVKLLNQCAGEQLKGGGPVYGSIVDLNDTTDHATVMKAFDCAIAKAKAGATR